jgi:hypothetical protein
MQTRTLYAVRRVGTDLWANKSGYPHWSTFEDAQIYHRKNPASARVNWAKKYSNVESEVVEIEAIVK